MYSGSCRIACRAGRSSRSVSLSWRSSGISSDSGVMAPSDQVLNGAPSACMWKSPLSQGWFSIFAKVLANREIFLLLATSNAATTVVVRGLPCRRPLVSKKVFSVPIALSFGGVACHSLSSSRTTCVSALSSAYLANCVGMVLWQLG